MIPYSSKEIDSVEIYNKLNDPNRKEHLKVDIDKNIFTLNQAFDHIYIVANNFFQTTYRFLFSTKNQDFCKSKLIKLDDFLKIEKPFFTSNVQEYFYFVQKIQSNIFFKYSYKNHFDIFGPFASFVEAKAQWRHELFLDKIIETARTIKFVAYGAFSKDGCSHEKFIVFIIDMVNVIIGLILTS